MSAQRSRKRLVALPQALSLLPLLENNYAQAAIADLLAERVAKLDHYKEIR